MKAPSNQILFVAILKIYLPCEPENLDHFCCRDLLRKSFPPAEKSAEPFSKETR